MSSYWLSTSALFFVHMGFAILFGAWINQARKKSPSRFLAAPISLGGMLLALAIWAIPIGTLGKAFLLLTSSLTLLITAFRLDYFHVNRDWMWLYAAFTMGLILIWSIGQGQAILAFSMSLLAAIASALALMRGKQIWLK